MTYHMSATAYPGRISYGKPCVSFDETTVLPRQEARRPYRHGGNKLRADRAAMGGHVGSGYGLIIRAWADHAAAKGKCFEII